MSLPKPVPDGDDFRMARLDATTKYEPPAWHRDVLESRRKAIENGTMTFIDWEEAKRELREMR